MDCVYMCMFVALCAVNIHGLSTLDRTDLIKYLEFYKNSANPFRDCTDKVNSSTCKKYEPYCGEIPKLKTVCKRTCGLCPAVSPMSCHMTRFGCCWDNITTSGPFGKGCPACEDKLRGCMKHYDECHIAHIRRACPITCGVRACIQQTHNCFDNPKQALFCPLFKKSGFCEIDEILMVEYCKKTCNLCASGSLTVKHRGANPPREVQKKTVITSIKESEKKKDSIVTGSVEKNSKIQDLLEEESTIQKKNKLSNEKDSKVKKSNEQYSKIMQESTKKSLVGQKKDNTGVNIAKTLVEIGLEKDEKAVATLERIGLVKDAVEKKTTDLLNDLIQDTISQQKKQKKEMKGNNEKKQKDTKGVEELEASLLDLLLKERSKDAK